MRSLFLLRSQIESYNIIQVMRKKKYIADFDSDNYKNELYYVLVISSLNNSRILSKSFYIDVDNT